jgi:hypothetical protein
MKNPLIYKNIQCNVNQLARLMTLIDNHLENQEEIIDIYKDKLNGADSTDDVRFCQETIKEKKDIVKAMLEIKKQMQEKEFTTKHTL